MEFQGGLKMIKNIRSMIFIIGLMEIGSFFPIFILIESAINIINAVNRYDMELFNGLWISANVLLAVMPVIAACIISGNYTNYYKLLIAMPMKLDKTPMQMMALADLTFLSVTIIDIIIMTICRLENAIFLKTAATLIAYTASYVIFYLNIRTGFKSYGITGKVVSIMAYILIYGISYTFYMTVSNIIHNYANELSDNNRIIIGVFIAAAAITLLARILSYKGVKNVVRQAKIYKVNNKKKDSTKLESYV